MPVQATIPSAPETYSEAEGSIQICISMLAKELERDMSGLNEEILIDQYARVISTLLWHDVARWRVEELLGHFQEMTVAIRAKDFEQTIHRAAELTEGVRQILAYKAWK